jgi:hypothetical protein
MKPIPIKIISGQMPQIWDRQVIFFANLLSLFYENHRETEILRQEVGAIESYGSRLVPIMNLLFQKANNLLILEKKPDAILLEYFRHTLGLSLPEILILPHASYLSLGIDSSDSPKTLKDLLNVLRNHPAHWLDGYVTDRILVRLAQKLNKKTISSWKGSRQGNNKLELHQFLESQDVPVFDNLIAKNLKDVPPCLHTLCAKGYHTAVIKASIGASGIGMKRIPLDANYQNLTIPDYLFHEGPCLIQGWLDETVTNVAYIGSPSVQMFVHDEHITLHDITEQILSKDSIHEGNIAPPPYLGTAAQIKNELLKQTGISGRWLHDQGYRGTASTDFHIIKRAGKWEIRICEINARVTGATYPSLLAHHFLPNSVWMMRNVRFDPPEDSRTLLETLHHQNFLYQPRKSQGILPFNFNPDHTGRIIKGQFLFLGPTLASLQEILQRMQDITTLKGVYDRD